MQGALCTVSVFFTLHTHILFYILLIGGGVAYAPNAPPRPTRSRLDRCLRNTFAVCDTVNQITQYAQSHSPEVSTDLVIWHRAKSAIHDCRVLCSECLQYYRAYQRTMDCAFYLEVLRKCLSVFVINFITAEILRSYLPSITRGTLELVR